jgi:hypothetical protein
MLNLHPNTYFVHLIFSSVNNKISRYCWKLRTLYPSSFICVYKTHTIWVAVYIGPPFKVNICTLRSKEREQKTRNVCTLTNNAAPQANRLEWKIEFN